MKLFLRSLAIASLSGLLPVLAAAQGGAPPVAPLPGDEPAESPPALGVRQSSNWEERYDEAGPSADPRPASPGVPPGEWVRTVQYGWVWMPYADAFTRVPPDGYGEPLMYVYRPAYGWCWLAAPWVWGLGVWPTFGVYGAVHFGWYGHGWWRTPERWHWRGDSHLGRFGPVRSWRGVGGSGQGTFWRGRAHAGPGVGHAFGGGRRGWGR